MDMSSLKAGIVGASESNLRQALKLVDAIAPCVLWCDEIEKAVGGYASSAQTDSGVTLGMVGQLLNWLQEHTSAVITVMTCNDFAKLPPELSRAGRIDEMFFVDLPSASERIEIARVHLNRYASKPNGQCQSIAKLSEGWTGAEIEQCIKVAARATSRAITDESLRAAAATIRPISQVRGDEIKALREWAKDRLRIANTVDKVSKSESGRSVEGD
jgi:SpoVK/Ycf46/Vps4 family AAA+-type ATPase